MSNEEKKVSIDHIKRAVDQADKVEKLAQQAKSSKDPKDGQQLEIEMEALAFYQTAAKGNPKSRARTVIEIARATALSRAITQPLPPLK